MSQYKLCSMSMSQWLVALLLLILLFILIALQINCVQLLIISPFLMKLWWSPIDQNFNWFFIIIDGAVHPFAIIYQT